MTDKDAKLSTKKRNTLPGKSFCGPNRSFPANDCPHVRAGLRLLNRAKVSDSTKSKIRACLNRKNTSMGCGVNSGDSEEKPDTALELIISSEEFEDTIDLISWIEEIEDTRTIQDKEVIKSRAVSLLGRARVKRIGTGGSKEELETYKNRKLDSLLHSLFDELEEIFTDSAILRN